MTAITAISSEKAPASSVAANINSNVLVLMIEGDYVNAYRLCKEALRREPENKSVRANLATVLKSLGREDEAVAIYEALLREYPTYGVAINNLAYSYLRRGRYTDGWPLYHQRLRSNANTTKPNNPLTGIPVYCDQPPQLEDLRGKHVLLVPEQGIGDELLFLRFVPVLAERARPASIWYAPSVKLFAIARRIIELRGVCQFTGMRFHGAPRDNAAAIMLGDLPLVLRHDGSWFPPSLTVDRAALPEAKVDERPTLGVTWRAGTVDGTHRGHLFKMTPTRELGEALRDVPYEILVIQRGAEEGEVMEFAQGLGRQFNTWQPPRGASTELLHTAARLSTLAGYVGVSNTNTHLLGLLGLRQHVLLGLPGEWRWPVTHPDSSPWFPQNAIYRKEMRDQWAPALGRLAADLKK
jgi:hypothetical protein